MPSSSKLGSSASASSGTMPKGPTARGGALRRSVRDMQSPVVLLGSTSFQPSLKVPGSRGSAGGLARANERVTRFGERLRRRCGSLWFSGVLKIVLPISPRSRVSGPLRTKLQVSTPRAAAGRRWFFQNRGMPLPRLRRAGGARGRRSSRRPRPVRPKAARADDSIGPPLLAEPQRHSQAEAGVLREGRPLDEACSRSQSVSGVRAVRLPRTRCLRHARRGVAVVQPARRRDASGSGASCRHCVSGAGDSGGRHE